MLRATATTVPENTVAPTVTVTPVISTSQTSGTNAWYSNLLADRSKAKLPTPQLEQWRLYLGVVLGIQLLLSFYVAVRTKRKNVGRNLAGSAIGILLTFTKVGEWMYNAILLILGWGLIGKIVLVILTLFTGLSGIGNLTAFVIGGYVYPDMQVLIYCVAPSIIIAIPMIFVYLRQARSKKVS